LYKILRKSKWNEACQLAFETLKRKLTTPPILAKDPFLVYIDSSEVAIGDILAKWKASWNLQLEYATNKS